MKSFLKEHLGVDDIETTNIEEIRNAVEPTSLIGRIKYRRQVGAAMNGNRPVIAKH